VISVAKQYRGQKGFFLEGMNKGDRDLFDNWQAAAAAKEQPLVIWYEDCYEMIGPNVSSSNLALISYVIENNSVTTSKVADELNISVHNASTKLKKLVDQGYIMRSEDIAETGGIEFIYHAIK
jgi:predicted transcriptional regulator